MQDRTVSKNALERVDVLTKKEDIEQKTYREDGEDFSSFCIYTLILMEHVLPTTLFMCNFISVFHFCKVLISKEIFHTSVIKEFCHNLL